MSQHFGKVRWRAASRDMASGTRQSPGSRGGRAYKALDTATEFFIYAVLLFTPWAFGTTEDWAIETTNTLNLILGGLLIGKWGVRFATGYVPRGKEESNGGSKRKWM